MPLGRRLAILLKVLGVFLLMGPPIGALAFFAGIGVYGVSQTGDVADLVWIALFGLIYAVPLSYFIGVMPAAAAGLILGGAAVLYRPPGFLFSIVTGVVVGLGLLYSGGGSVELPGAKTVSNDVPAVLLITTCLVATVLCWAVARCFVGGRSASVSRPVGLGRK